MKPIFLNEADKEKMIEEFKKELENQESFDGKISFTRTLTYKKDQFDPAIIMYTPNAYIKMVSLVKDFDSEVAWHALVKRSDTAQDIFVVYDVLVYPQEVTGVTVNTDQEEYTKFLIDLDEDTANNMLMQCHSHVNMGTTPSGVDTEHQNNILKTMTSGFYIFQIWNKRGEINSWIYDLDNNILYEKDDVIIDIATDNGIISEFIADAKAIVKKKETFTKNYGKTAVTYENEKKKEKAVVPANASKEEENKKDPNELIYDTYTGGYLPRYIVDGWY